MPINKKRLLFYFFIIITVAITSCTREKIVEPDYAIYGSWVRLITDSQGIQFNAELKINKNNSFDFILLDNAPGHTNSAAEFTLNEGTMTIINDSDCNVDGAYEFVVSKNID